MDTEAKVRVGGCDHVLERNGDHVCGGDHAWAGGSDHVWVCGGDLTHMFLR